jgi:hypothetical protein
MTQHVAIENVNPSPSQVLSRRQVMLGVAGLTFAVALGRDRSAAAARSQRSGPASHSAPG